MELAVWRKLKLRSPHSLHKVLEISRNKCEMWGNFEAASNETFQFRRHVNIALSSQHTSLAIVGSVFFEHGRDCCQEDRVYLLRSLGDSCRRGVVDLPDAGISLLSPSFAGKPTSFTSARYTYDLQVPVSIVVSSLFGSFSCLAFSSGYFLPYQRPHQDI